jgi:hypothetical protein
MLMGEEWKNHWAKSSRELSVSDRAPTKIDEFGQKWSKTYLFISRDPS